MCCEIYKDHDLGIYELLNLPEKYFMIFGSKLHCI